MAHDNLDLGVLQDTKLTDGVYTYGSAVYIVIATECRSDNAV